MNQDNCASPEASKRLVDAGIVLETDCVWRKKRGKTGYYLSRKALYHRTTDIPAPCMAEGWRELPGEIKIDGRWLLKHLHQDLVFAYAEYYGIDQSHTLAKQCQSINPTDALIDLLIWVRKEAKDV